MTCLKVFLGIAVGVAGSASAADAWPFAILRNYGSYEANRAFLDRVFAAQERHPGLIEEIWFGPGLLGPGPDLTALNCC